MLYPNIKFYIPTIEHLSNSFRAMMQPIVKTTNPLHIPISGFHCRRCRRKENTSMKGFHTHLRDDNLPPNRKLVIAPGKPLTLCNRRLAMKRNLFVLFFISWTRHNALNIQQYLARPSFKLSRRCNLGFIRTQYCSPTIVYAQNNHFQRINQMPYPKYVHTAWLFCSVSSCCHEKQHFLLKIQNLFWYKWWKSIEFEWFLPCPISNFFVLLCFVKMF